MEINTEQKYRDLSIEEFVTFDKVKRLYDIIASSVVNYSDTVLRILPEYNTNIQQKGLERPAKDYKSNRVSQALLEIAVKEKQSSRANYELINDIRQSKHEAQIGSDLHNKYTKN